LTDPDETFRLLLVDDDEVDRAAVRRLLRDASAVELAECGRADEVGACLARAGCDAVLLDFHLPGGDGLEVLREIRATHPETAVIMLTGHGDEQLAVELMKAGASDYIAKSALSADRLAASIRQSVRAVRAERAARRLEDERRILLLRERNAREEAEAASLAKDHFLAMVSHELRTPLNAILGWARILRTHAVGPADQAKGLETIERNARVQAQLIEDLLDVSRIVSGTLRLDRRPTDPTAVVNAAVDALRVQAEARGIHLLAEIEDTGITLNADADRLQQVVWNLLSNAVKFTPHGGRVAVKLARTGSGIEITVSDDGAGIPREFLPRIFERFAQSAAGERKGGLGLGLAIVRHIVELHGGTVTAESGGAGLGSRFRVLLPADAATGRDETIRAALSEPLPRRPQLEGLKVLVVDDHEDTRVVVRQFLERHGADITACGTAGEALVSIADRLPDVLVSDIEMPGDDGYTLIRELRARGHDAERVPAVALTGAARVEDRIRTLAAGYQMHLPKPVDPDELVSAVASLGRRPVSPLPGGPSSS
jgi:signal transduction histidine kinase